MHWMSWRGSWRRLLLGLVASLALAAAGLSLPIAPGVTPAQAQVSAEFQEALAPYGHWQRHARWGEVWVPDNVPPDWQPYVYGHWVYTDEWGWYWISDPEEEEWGWIVYHYGRWIHDRGSWFWIPDDEWAPAWVDWRYGSGYVGWAPLPPEELIYEYDEAPTYWIFVPPRFLTASRLHPYFLHPSRRADVFRRSHVINRTLRYNRGRAAVNPGISPAFVARRLGRSLPTYRVSPHVLTGTQGVAGAVRVSPQQARAQRGQRPRAVAVAAHQHDDQGRAGVANAAAAHPWRTRPPRRASAARGTRGAVGAAAAAAAAAAATAARAAAAATAARAAAAAAAACAAAAAGAAGAAATAASADAARRAAAGPAVTAAAAHGPPGPGTASAANEAGAAAASAAGQASAAATRAAGRAAAAGQAGAEGRARRQAGAKGARARPAAIAALSLTAPARS